MMTSPDIETIPGNNTQFLLNFIQKLATAEEERNIFFTEDAESATDTTKVTITAAVVFGFPVIVLFTICLLRFRISRLRKRNRFMVDRKIESISNSTYIPIANDATGVSLKSNRTPQNLDVRQKNIQNESGSNPEKTKEATIDRTVNSNMSSPGYDFIVRDAEHLKNISRFVIDYETVGDAMCVQST